MKKNPLFYERTNANSFKIAFAKRKLFLSMALFLIVSFITAASISNPTDAKGFAKTTGISLSTLAIVPLIAYKAGEQGEDESKEDFEARKGKGETPENFIKRCMHYIADEKLKEFKKSDPEYKELKSFKDAIDNCVRKKDFEALSEKVGDMKIPNVEEIKEELKKQSLAIEALKEIHVGKDRGIKKGSIAETLAQNKEKIAAFVSGKSSKQLNIEHKASETSTDITNREMYAQWHEPGIIGQIPVRKPFIRELFKNLNAGTEYLKYTDQATVVRDAKNVALCAASTHNTKLTWIVRTMQITKIRDFIDVCIDMMDDYLFVAGEIENLLDSSVKLKIDDQLLFGTGVNPELNSLTSISSTWAANIAGTTDYTASVTMANLIDLIVIANSQIQQLGKNNAWNPNYVLVNPGDYTLMMLMKNTLGDTLRMNPNLFVDANGNIKVAGLSVIANPNIAANTFWIGDFRKGTVYAIPGYGIELSYENATNFETETVTVKAYERLNLLVRNVDTNAFMFIPDITTALATINKP